MQTVPFVHSLALISEFLLDSLRFARRMGFAFSIVGSVSLSQSTASAQSTAPPVSIEPVSIASVRHPITKDLIEISYQPTPPQTLKTMTHAKVQAKLNQQIESICAHGKFSASAIALDFSAEFVAFSTAVAIESLLNAGDDPAALRHMAESQFLDPMSYASFAGFLAGSRGMHTLLAATGAAFDPCRQMKAGRITTKLTTPTRIDLRVPGLVKYDTINTHVTYLPEGPTRLQKTLSFFTGPMGLAAGMAASNIMHDVTADQDLKLCAASKIKPEIPPEIARASCEAAWENWKISKKALDYTPGILSLTAAFVVQGLVINKALLPVFSGWAKQHAIKRGAERFIPLVLRTFQFSKSLGALVGPGRLLKAAGNILVFMQIEDLISPWITQPFERIRQGEDITNSANELLKEVARIESNNWIWSPRPDSEFCPEAYDVDLTTGTMFLDGAAACTAPKQQPPDFILKMLNKKNVAWRQFLLQEPVLAHRNWADYSANFIAGYSQAWTFYDSVIRDINEHRFTTRGRTNPPALFKAHPFWGIGTTDIAEGEDPRKKAIDNARRWLEEYLESNVGRKQLDIVKVDLQTILRGLKSIDRTVSTLDIVYDPLGFRQFKGLDPFAESVIAKSLREDALETAMRLLRDRLNSSQAFSDRNIPFPSPMYSRMAETNPYMRLRLLLGDPNPQPEGLAALETYEGDPKLLPADTKRLHPGGIGRAKTALTTDYLLASMVCGPEVENSGQVLTAITEAKSSNPINNASERILSNGKMAISSRTSAIAITQKSDKESPILSEWWSIRANFYPPRIIKNLGVDLCASVPRNLSRDQSTFRIHDGEWMIHGEQVVGFLNVVKKYIRDSLLLRPEQAASGRPPIGEPFDLWWNKYIEPAAKEAIVRIRGNYRDLLEKKFLPIMNSTESREYNKRTFHLGVLKSIRSSAEFNLLMIGKTASLGAAGQARAEFTRFADQVLFRLSALGTLATDLQMFELNGARQEEAYATARADYLEAVKQLEGFMKELPVRKNQSQNGGPTVDLGANTRTAIGQAAFAQLNAFAGEIDAYYGLVRSVRLRGQ